MTPPFPISPLFLLLCIISFPLNFWPPPSPSERWWYHLWTAPLWYLRCECKPNQEHSTWFYEVQFWKSIYQRGHIFFKTQPLFWFFTSSPKISIKVINLNLIPTDKLKWYIVHTAFGYVLHRLICPVLQLVQICFGLVLNFLDMDQNFLDSSQNVTFSAY